MYTARWNILINVRTREAIAINSRIRNLNFYIKATFAKFKEWQHEREYRFVCILDENTEGAQEVLGDWVVIPQVDVVQGYAGCNNQK